MSTASSQSDVNRSAVLAQIGANGPASRAELARLIGVSPALVTQITKQLLADGLIVELEFTPSNGGRPARQLGLAADAGHAIGVKVAPDHATFVEVGIDGSVVRSATEPFDTAALTAVATLAGMLRGFIDGGGDRPLLGLGVGLPADVDDQSLGNVNSTQLGWSRAPLGNVLRQELELPVLVENNVNALAMAEMLHGQARGHEDVLVVTIGTGIGAGIIADGVIVRGHGGGAGEIGHFPVDREGPQCQCGARGCLEAFIGQDALVRRAKEQGTIPASGTITTLRTQADAGDAASVAMFAEAGGMLGRVVAGVANVLDPEILILLGEGIEAWAHWRDAFDEAFRSALMPRKRGLEVAVETWQDDRWAQGAASLVLATPFDAAGLAGEQGRLVRERLTGSGGAGRGGR
ncbi:ROK family transcriptional regulator [Tessaracoccus rhinocerotis]|uniref:ROK family transcriptional regulator n=1 Tax=Tessaracoccus rhinocerotis TaxID=1689449 RepID=A0A553K4H5_9ACTN|nr:ROK family transcriptional regulator [Tessaracoccus rhinocerotis]TRY19618.1 ROK family transcriptional regulator [Tessaracoccus rhinocerotis]